MKIRPDTTNFTSSQTLTRHAMSYMITYYLPSGLFVVVSWISFLIPPDIVPGRMSLLITLFLVLINIFNNVTTNSPKAEGLTAIEIWMLACILFVFGKKKKKHEIWVCENRVGPLIKETK